MLHVLKDYLKQQYHLHEKAANYAFFALLGKSNPRQFVRLCNLRNAIKGVATRFHYDAQSDLYHAQDSAGQMQFSHPLRGYKLYRNGLQARAGRLGWRYYFDKIPLDENDLIVDCGANYGDLALYCQLYDTPLRYVGFEPSPQEFACLQANAAAGQAVHQLGLWHEEGALEFYLSPRFGDSSLIKPKHYEAVQTVACRRLDTLLDEPVKLLKVEAEGAEPEVLLGCEKLLPNTTYIAVDCGPERGEKQEYTLAAVNNYLLGHDFEMIACSFDRIIALFHNKTMH